MKNAWATYYTKQKPWKGVLLLITEKWHGIYRFANEQTNQQQWHSRKE